MRSISISTSWTNSSKFQPLVRRISREIVDIGDNENDGEDNLDDGDDNGGGDENHADNFEEENDDEQNSSTLFKSSSYNVSSR